MYNETPSPPVPGDAPATKSRRLDEGELQLQRVFFQSLFESSLEAIVILDTLDRVVAVNGRFRELFDYTDGEIKGRELDPLIVPEHLRAEAAQLSSTSPSGSLEELESTRQRKDGSEVEVAIRACAIEMAGDRIGAFRMYRNIGEHKEQKRRLERMSRFDPLTDLPNRFLFEDRLKQAIGRTHRTQELVAVHFLNLDHFKTVNDNLGQSVGNALLKAVARRLRAEIRESDTFARLGSDEFAIVQTGVKTPAAVTALATKMIDLVTHPFSLKGNELHTSITIGIALSSPEIGAERLTAQAETALRKGKDKGRRHFHFHDPEMDLEVRSYVNLLEDMHSALARKEFFLEYQPQVDLADQSILGVEALVRWEHPKRGRLGPNAFIPLAESSGLIVSLGSWILKEACRQCKTWCDDGLREIPIAVNISPIQFRDPRFTERVLEALDETGLPPRLLRIEITETTLMEKTDMVGAALTFLHDHEIGCSIDDFGTGYSSMQYLKEYSVEKLKISPEFIEDIANNPDDAAIVEAIVSLGHTLGLKVLAEGVETGEQLGFLRELRCEEAQGFFFSRPVSAEAFAEQLQKGSL